MKEIKYCPYCRADIATGHKFCGACGKKIPIPPTSIAPEPKPIPEPVPETAPEPVAPIASPKSTTTEASQNTGKSTNTAMISVVAVSIIIIVGAILWYVFSGKEDNNSYVSTYEPETEIVNEQETQVTADNNTETTTQTSNDYNEDYPEDEMMGTDCAQEDLYDFACQREVTANDIGYMTKEDLRIMRNWIYARHGYIFKSRDLKEYFSQYSWYSPRYSDVSSQLSKIEKRNVEFIKRHE